MATITDQLTHDLTAIEREIARIHRELTQFQISRPTKNQRMSLVSAITSMALPVSNWEDMEEELYRGRTCF